MMKKTLALVLVFGLIAPGWASESRPAIGDLKRVSELGWSAQPRAEGAIIAPVIAVAAAAALLAGCATVPVTGRKQFNIMPEGMMNDMGEDAWRQVKSKERTLQHGRDKEMLMRIARRVISASGMEGGWEVELFDAPKTANAFAIPGRKIGVYTGILPHTRDEAGLAAVIGHEVAHVMAKHGAERVSQQVGLQFGLIAASEILQRKMEDPTARAAVLAGLGVGASLGVILPFSRSHESEADHIGILLMAKAGYDPHAAPELWKRMPSGGGPEWVSTHPSHERRVRDLETWLPEALQHYRQAAGTAR